MTRMLIFLTLITILIGCSEDNHPNFSGITETNESAIVIGSQDESDWSLDENWNNAEVELFDGLTLNSVNNEGESVDFSSFGINSLGPAYPNPTKGNFIIPTLQIEFSKGELVLVNNRYEIIAGPVELRSGSDIQFQIEASGQILRVYYYYLIDDDNVYLKGHGDILFE